MPKFMVHDQWANVLFLHWRVPKELEPLLLSANDFLILDRTPDGSAWIGLILLTEENVGLPVLRSACTTITHHGVNVRTYVKATSDNETTRGILFSSLECNDRFAALGANFFGMPYKVADMERRYYVKGEKEHNDEEIFPDDDVTHSNSRSIQKYKLSSVRSPRQSSLMNLILSIIMPVFRFFLFLPSDSSTKAAATSSFTIECEWERRSQQKENDSSSLIQFFVERYYVYTRKYGLNWRGQVEHDPWPVERAQLTK